MDPLIPPPLWNVPWLIPGAGYSFFPGHIHAFYLEYIYFNRVRTPFPLIPRSANLLLLQQPRRENSLNVYPH